MAFDPAELIFSLAPLNSRAEKAISHKYNAAFSSTNHGESHLNFGAFTNTKDPNKILTIATMGSDREMSDVYIPGNDIDDMQCAFVFNYATGVVLVEDRSMGETRVFQDATSQVSVLSVPDRRRRVAVVRNYNTVLSLGKKKNAARFRFVWNLDPDESYRIVRKRIEGASLSIRRDFIYGFRNQADREGDDDIVHYPIVELGMGAFGMVWKTIDAFSGGLMAVKRLHPPSDPNQPAWITRVQKTRDREIRFLSEMNHPHIVEFLGSQGWEGGNIEIFMPIKKGNLESLILSSGEPPSRGFVTTVLMQTLSALDYLAANELIHRDVKPENILYDTNHRGEYIFQLADFGLANDEKVAKTANGTIIYIAPEVLDQSATQTSKMDVWSLFVTMLWVTDKLLFRYVLEVAIDHVDIRKGILYCGMSSGFLSNLLPMVIWDPVHRASAGSMLAFFGRRDLITSAVVPELSPDHFDKWMETIWNGQSPYSDYLRALLGQIGIGPKN